MFFLLSSSFFPNSHQSAIGSPGYVPGARQETTGLNMTKLNPGLLTSDQNLHSNVATLGVSVWVEHM